MTREALKTDLILIQPTPFCNIDCRYCYLPDRNVKARVSDETLEDIFYTIFNSGINSNPISIVWHCGEPTVLPVSFYKNALQIQARHNKADLRIKNAFQTNGTLLTPEWCSFFKDADISVGVSVDGPSFIHDKSRVDRSGRGTHARVVAGMKLLAEHQIPYHVLMVLTADSLRHPKAIWDFLVDMGVSRVGFNCEEIEGVNKTSSVLSDECVALYRQFFSEMLRLRAQEKRNIAIRETDHFVNFILFAKEEMRATENTPLRIISFDYNGGISTFSPEMLGMRLDDGDFVFGSARERNLVGLLDNPRFRQVKEEIDAGAKLCKQQCDYFYVCGGGAPSNKLFENGTFSSSETMCCKLRIKTLCDVVLEHVESKDFVWSVGPQKFNARWS